VKVARTVLREPGAGNSPWATRRHLKGGEVKNILVYSFTFFTLLLSSCALPVPNSQRIDDKPMYGQPEIPRPGYMQKIDEVFINEAISGFGGDRNEASIAWAAVAEDFFRKGNLHYAMRRYNQAWLLDPENYLAYWGFGQVALARDEFDSSIKYLEKAKKLINDTYQEPALLSDTGSAYLYKAMSISVENSVEREKYFALAYENFEKSTKLDPNYPHSWKRWGYALYDEGKYLDAWEKINKAQSLGEQVSEKFLSHLSSKMPNPKK